MTFEADEIKRKVVQLVVLETNTDFLLVALCDDGSIWCERDYGDEWRQIEAPPGCYQGRKN